jgi:FlaA1/EpsC-like NDP-sugar epimerase
MEIVAVAAISLIVGVAVSMVFGACAQIENIKTGEVMYKSILITGGTGFFGQAFVRAALAQNLSPRICIFSRDEYKQALMRAALGDDPRLRWFVGDVRDRDRLRRAMEGVDLVIHAAALKRVEVGEYNPTEMVKTNVMGSMNVIEAAIDAGVARVVALSTDKACEPSNAYGASKLMLEKLFLAANNMSGAGGTRFAACRYGNVAGSTGSVIPNWRAAGDKVVTLTDPDATRFYMTINHAVRMVLGVAKSMKGGELKIPNLPAYRLGDLAEAMGVKVRVVGLGAGEKKHESMVSGETSEHARRMTVDELREAISHA